MSAIDRAPATQNFLSPVGFRFILSRSPEINYFIQHVDIPDMTMDVAVPQTPFNRIQYPGEKVTYGDLTITFKVDENLTNFLHIYNWMSDLSKQNNFNGYRAAATAAPGTMAGVFSDATLVVMTSSYNANKQVVFKNIFPTHLTGLTFDSTMNDITYLQATATFAMQKYEIINA